MVTRAAKAASYVPARGDVVSLDFDPTVGHEQGRVRPALVLSPVTYNQASELMLACPITNTVKGHPYEVPIPPGCGLTGVVLVHQLRCIDWRARAVRYRTSLGTEVLDEVLQKLLTLVDPQEN